MTTQTWKWEIPEFFNIGSACTDAHLDSPTEDKPAMILEETNGSVAVISYIELCQKTDAFADYLTNVLGLAPQSRILIRLANSLEYPICFLGAIKAGMIAVPTSTLLTAEEVSYLANDSGASLLVTQVDMWSELKPRISGKVSHLILTGSSPDAPSLDDIISNKTSFTPKVKTKADDPAYLVYTSGTTGYPKGVLHAQRALIGRTPASKYWFNFEGEDRILHSGKFNWTYVLGTGLMDPLYHGKTVVVYEGKNDPGLWPRLIAKHQCTIFIGVPTVYRQIIQKTDASAATLPSLRHCMSAGEHLSDELQEQWQERFGRPVYEAIGMSEFSYYISQPVDKPVRPGSAGFPQPGHAIRLLDEDLKPVPAGEEGMICVPETDPGLFLNYWNLPDETAKSRKGGWFMTGDYARIDEDGYIWFIGRRDDIINSFGYRISPHEVERVMKTHPEVADCVALPQEIGKDKTLVAAAVILTPGSAVTSENLLEFGKEHLADYKRPKNIFLFEDFPRTKNGKVLRKALKLEIEKIYSGN